MRNYDKPYTETMILNVRLTIPCWNIASGFPALTHWLKKLLACLSFLEATTTEIPKSSWYSIAIFASTYLCFPTKSNVLQLHHMEGNQIFFQNLKLRNQKWRQYLNHNLKTSSIESIANRPTISNRMSNDSVRSVDASAVLALTFFPWSIANLLLWVVLGEGGWLNWREWDNLGSSWWGRTN